MKILWFTNTPCGAADKMGAERHRGGWLKSLEQEISYYQGLDLYIAFYSATKMAPFKLHETNYYPVFRKSNRTKLSRYIRRITATLKEDLSEIKVLLKLVEEIKPDLIHIHGTEDNFGLMQSKVACPVIISIQGILTPYIEKFYAGVTSSSARKYEKLLDKLNFKSAYFIHKNLTAKVEREKKILKLSQYIIGRTDWDRRVSKVLAPASRYFNNSEIMRPAFYKERPVKTAFNEEFIIVTVSSDTLYKGYETVVQTAIILKSNSRLKFKWIVIGLHEKAGIVKLVSRMTGINSSDINIELAGSLGESEIQKILISADLYCQVSHIENSPNSLCEAMLMAMPIVASYAGGTSSLIVNGAEGITVQDGDAYSFAGAILEMSNDFKTASAYGARARNQAMQRHNKLLITDGLVCIYNTILGEKEIATSTTSNEDSIIETANN